MTYDQLIKLSTLNIKNLHDVAIEQERARERRKPFAKRNTGKYRRATRRAAIARQWDWMEG